VLVIGGGNVGESALRALQRKDIPANLLEKDAARAKRLAHLCDETFVGDASTYELVKAAGIEDAPSVLLTTNDDAMNIFLTSYCRQLNPDIRIVSRLTSERNLDAIHRAGADFVLSYVTLAVNAVASVLHNRSLTVLGEGIDLFPFAVTPSLNMVSIAESGIGQKTGMSVVAVRKGDETLTRFSPSFRFEPGMELLLIGSTKQFETLHHLYP
jgi:Trk K+ transport system NAD-binding subunit